MATQEDSLGAKRILVGSSNWDVHAVDASLRLDAGNRALGPGWYRITIKWSRDLSDAEPPVLMLENQTIGGLPFRWDMSARYFVLYFNVGDELQQIALDLKKPISDEMMPQIRIQQVSGVWVTHKVLWALSKSGTARGGSVARIYRKSLARWRRRGYRSLLSHLLAEYQGTAVTLSSFGEEAYLAWIKRNERESPALGAATGSGPCISVLLPVSNPPERYLRRALESVVNQSYGNWELCIAYDASSQGNIRSILREFAHLERRIKVLFCNENGHTAITSNSALSLAIGDYVALLDQDEELTRNALKHIAEAVAANPGVRFLYSDEDRIGELGDRLSPYFKCSWNPDLLRSHNYIGRLMVIEKALLLEVGGFRGEFEANQDYDTALRCTSRIASAAIIHIPRVLYHRRALPQSTETSVAQSQINEAGLRALQDLMGSMYQGNVNVSPGCLANSYRVRYPVPQPPPLVSLIIPSRDQLPLLKVCVESILGKSTYPSLELLIVDNQSKAPETLRWLRDIKKADTRVRVLAYDDEFSFSRINNFAVTQARGEVIGLVNNDIEVITPDWLEEMVSQAMRPEVGCVGAKLYYRDGGIQHAGIILGIYGVAGHAHKHFARSAQGYAGRAQLVQNFSAVTGACLIVRKSVYKEVGGLDENLKVALNDVDFCIRVREAGYRNLWTPYAELFHHESRSRGYEDTDEKRERFDQEVKYMRDRWGALLDSDPYYSPHLTLVREDFSIRT